MFHALIVTPDPRTRDIVKVGLEQTGALTVESVEVDAALKTLTNATFNLLVVDSTLKEEGDGLDFVGRALEIASETEVLLIAREEKKSKRPAKSAAAHGIAGTLRLPVDPVEFFKTIARVLERIHSDTA